MKQDIRTFLLVLAGVIVATVLLGSLARAGEYWAIPVILALGVLVLLGIREYKRRKRVAASRARYAQAIRRSRAGNKKGGRNG